MNKDINQIKNYFSEEILEQIRSVSNEDMRNHLKSLEGTKLWFAILKYAQNRVAVLQDSFLTLDPLKDASKISQYQGVITGILDLQDAVLSLKYESKKKEDPKYKEELNKDELGGAYGVV